MAGRACLITGNRRFLKPGSTNPAIRDLGLDALVIGFGRGVANEHWRGWKVTAAQPLITRRSQVRILFPLLQHPVSRQTGCCAVTL
jgi:hypothetical protein